MTTTRHETALHCTMAFVGGVFGVYALLEHSNVFGSAQTNNLISIVEGLLSMDLFHVLVRLGSLFIYAAGIVLTVWLSKRYPEYQKRTSILIDCLAALILGLMPRDINPFVAVYPIAFAMSIQWCSFVGVNKNASATTFSTNNFRQLVTAVFNYAEQKNHKDLFRIKFYISTLLSFHSGVAVICVVWQYVPHHCIWLTFAPLLMALVLDAEVRRRKSAVQSNPT